jgi:ABC-type spermidine/putrescine transport system permease subunit II
MEPGTPALGLMTSVLVGIAAVVFAVLAGTVHTVWERRRQRRAREQWEERERLLNRRS